MNWREHFEVWIKWKNTGDWQKIDAHPNVLEARASAKNVSTSGGRVLRVEVRERGQTTGECVYDASWR